MREVSSIRVHRRFLLAAVAAMAALIALPATSGATMPGGNGRIAFQKFAETGSSTEVSVWSMNGDGSGAVRLTSGKDAFEGTYSPDGSRLAFGRYDEIIVAAADGSNPRLLAPGSTKETETVRWVANFEDPETGTVYPWVKIEERRLERDTRAEPSFSPDGTALAVAHYTSTEISEYVCSVNANNNPNCNGTYSENFYRCENCGSSIEAIDANTGAMLTTIVPKASGVYLSGPSYSSTGAVAYLRDEAGAGPRQVLSVASPGAAPTTIASGQVNHPDFSPDGARVAYVAGNHEIAVVAASGGTPIVIPVPPPAPSSKVWSARSPIWSPDGSLIAFANTGSPGAFETFTDGGVFLMRPDGSGMALIQGDATIPTGWQPLPLPPPPAVRARAVKGKKKVRLSKKGVGVVGKVVCGSNPCSLKATSAKLKVGKKRFGVKAIFPKSLLPSATAVLKVKVKGKAMAALKARRGGKLKLEVLVSEGSAAATLPFAPKLLPPKKQKKGKPAGSRR
jgi:Tol biopolymer transport system component